MTADESAPASSSPAPEETPRVEVRNLAKRYGSVQALRDVNMKLHAGEIVGLVGDNGAGKLTLVNIIAGALQPTSGSILLDGKPVSFRSPIEARAAGIETVYQDLALAPDLSIWANMFLGREKVVSGPLGWLGWLDRKSMMAETRQGPGADPDQDRLGGQPASAASPAASGRRSRSSRAVAWGSRVVLMDEPTAALGVEQQARVGELIQTVAGEGTPVLLISHNLQQVLRHLRPRRGAVPRHDRRRPAARGDRDRRHRQLDHRSRRSPRTEMATDGRPSDRRGQAEPPPGSRTCPAFQRFMERLGPLWTLGVLSSW